MATKILSRRGNWRHGYAVGSSIGATPEYKTWRRIIERCCNSRCKSFKDYGGRGIKVCSRWLDGAEGKHPFVCFLEDMGQKAHGQSIERIDVNGAYEPSNCRWASRVEQARNTRCTAWVDFNGRRMSLAEAAEVAGLPYKTVHIRIKRGWSAERALHEPLHPR